MSGKLQMKKATTTAPVRQETTELKPTFKYCNLQVCQVIALFVEQNHIAILETLKRALSVQALLFIG